MFSYFWFQFPDKDGALYGPEDFYSGDITWAKSGKKDPFWPAIVIDPMTQAPELVLRSCIPDAACVMFFRYSGNGSQRMDKATLLAEVIRQVKELQKKAMEASDDHLIPLDDDEVKVEEAYINNNDGSLHFKASLCCEYKPGILSDVRQAIEALPLEMVSAEVSTLGDRLKSVLVLTSTSVVDDTSAGKYVSDSIQKALNSVLEKGSTSPEYSPRTTLPNKKRRITFFDSSSSSS